jgi:hypothetical protein
MRSRVDFVQLSYVQLYSALCSCVLRFTAVCRSSCVQNQQCAKAAVFICVQKQLCSAVCRSSSVQLCAESAVFSCVYLTYVLSKGILLIYSNIRSLSSSEDLKLVFLSPSSFSGVSILGVSGGHLWNRESPQNQ